MADRERIPWVKSSPPPFNKRTAETPSPAKPATLHSLHDTLQSPNNSLLNSPKPPDFIAGSIISDANDDYRDYFANKRAKQISQFQPTAAFIKTSIFAKCVVLVNGLNIQKSIQRIVHENGGEFEDGGKGTMSRRVTHVICQQVSEANGLLLRKARDVRKHVKPSWIYACVAAGTKVDEGGHFIDQMKHDRNAVSITNAFKPASKPASKPSSSSLTGVTGTYINTLDDYFKSSRLSFIGSHQQRRNTSTSTTTTTTSTTTTTTTTTPSTTYTLHVDLDSFFASVALRDRPDLVDKPVAVCAPGGEISTCNYIARAQGVRKGSRHASAIKLCPTLVQIDYDFDAYDEVSHQLAEILAIHADANLFEQMSCDEAYLQVVLENPPDPSSHSLSLSQELPPDTTSPDVSFPTHVRSLSALCEQIRSDILRDTRCTASVGVAKNKLLAKLCTDQAKPNKRDCGFFLCQNFRALLRGMSLREVHGIGRKSAYKLEVHNLLTVGDIWKHQDALALLKSEFGDNKGALLYDNCQGVDRRPVQPIPRQSVGAQCSTRVRFDGQSMDWEEYVSPENRFKPEAFPFTPLDMIRGLAEEVERRMKDNGVRGKKITLKLWISDDIGRHPGKFLGHGSCTVQTKTTDLPRVTDATADMCSAAGRLYSSMKPPVSHLRGIGIQIGVPKEDEEAGAMDRFLRAPTPVKIAPADEAKLVTLLEMGYDEDAAKGALQAADNNIDQALDSLLRSPSPAPRIAAPSPAAPMDLIEFEHESHYTEAMIEAWDSSIQEAFKQTMERRRQQEFASRPALAKVFTNSGSSSSSNAGGAEPPPCGGNQNKRKTSCCGICGELKKGHLCTRYDGKKSKSTKRKATPKPSSAPTPPQSPEKQQRQQLQLQQQQQQQQQQQRAPSPPPPPPSFPTFEEARPKLLAWFGEGGEGEGEKAELAELVLASVAERRLDCMMQFLRMIKRLGRDEQFYSKLLDDVDSGMTSIRMWPLARKELNL